jgi:type 2 lantibiotic biosynthesis protein LanM
VVPLGTDLYDGLPGVALFLGYLGHVTGQRRYTALSRAALATLRHHLRRSGDDLNAVGGFEGWGGVIYALAHLGALWEWPGLLGEAGALVERLPGLIEQDETLDIISGAAGCIAGLLSLQACAPSGRTLAVALQCGERLLARAQTMPTGIGWPAPMPASGPLTGFSHGAAGIAWALLELAALTGQARFRTAALEAIAYERSLFSPQTGNWPDLRLESAGEGPEETAECFLAWCHGAPGIGLARVQALRHLDDPLLHEEIAAAVGTTLARGFGRNHCLCHGDMGNLEFVMQAAQVRSDKRWRAEGERWAATILESIERDGWLCAVPLGVEAPGLMTGLAGIGYGLLRLAEPAQVPSVLALETPPVARWRREGGR